MNPWGSAGYGSGIVDFVVHRDWDRDAACLSIVDGDTATITHVRTPARTAILPGRGQNLVRDLTMNDATEHWLPVVGYEGFYEVSNLGRVRSVDRTIESQNRRRFHPGQIRKPSTHKAGGYPMVGLNKPGNQKTFCLHRLVAMAFHGPPPADKPVIRHLNGDPLDNRPENLTWGTHAENTQDMVRHGRAYWTNRTHCKYGHEFTPENTKVSTDENGVTRRRDCRTCGSVRAATGRAKRQAKKRAAWPTLTCRVCQCAFRNPIPRTQFCSEECRRVHRRQEFGWQRQGRAS